MWVVLKYVQSNLFFPVWQKNHSSQIGCGVLGTFPRYVSKSAVKYLEQAWDVGYDTKLAKTLNKTSKHTPTPPTMAGKKKTAIRQTLQRSKLLSILIFLTDPSKSAIKKDPFLDPFLCHKKTPPNTLNKRYEGCNEFCKFFGGNGPKCDEKTVKNHLFCLFGHQKRVLWRAIFLVSVWGGSCNEKSRQVQFLVGYAVHNYQKRV